jgi:hypothetical protein
MTKKPTPSHAATVAASICTADHVVKSLFAQMAHPASILTQAATQVDALPSTPAATAVTDTLLTVVTDVVDLPQPGTPALNG